MSADDRQVPADADVVIVGAGSAGCVVARRLAEAGVRVVLLEAGPPDVHPIIFDPTQVLDLWFTNPAGQALNWGYESVAQEHLGGRRVPMLRGKVMGGTSSINAMYHARGHRSDFDTWAYLGNAGWSYDDVLPVFKRSEDFDGERSEHRGAGGPLPVMSRYEPHPLVAAQLAAADQAGIRANPDYNGACLGEGSAPIQFNIRGGKRVSSARAFIEPVVASPNLVVVSGCHVQRLLVEGGRCTGVEVRHDGRAERIRAEGEVVVSAGVFDSPKLLMLSGIGPATHLREVGVDIVVDLPGVGENLQDHAFAPLVYAASRTVPPALTGLVQFHGTMFWHSRSGLLGPDLQSIVGHLPFYPEGYHGPADGFSYTATLNRPASRGTVRLASADPAAAPMIDPRYASRDADVDAIASGIQLLREVVAQPALDPWRGEEVCPGPSVRTLDDLRAYVRNTLAPIYHLTSTCKMGVDELAVVDPELAVYGVEGLRVADASVMPLVTSANTHVPTVMIAERAAEIVLADINR